MLNLSKNNTQLSLLAVCLCCFLSACIIRPAGFRVSNFTDNDIYFVAIFSHDRPELCDNCVRIFGRKMSTYNNGIIPISSRNSIVIADNRNKKLTVDTIYILNGNCNYIDKIINDKNKNFTFTQYDDRVLTHITTNNELSNLIATCPVIAEYKYEDIVRNSDNYDAFVILQGGRLMYVEDDYISKISHAHRKRSKMHGDN